MTAASHKFDPGQSNPNKCFPSRKLAFPRRTNEGAGHWLVAYRQAEEQKYRKVHRRIKETDRGADPPQGVTLDGPFLLQLHCVDEPSELCSVDISDQQLSSVKPEDLEAFDNVAYINASINSLTLGSFSSFLSLRELSLSLNGCCNMTFNGVDFPHLEVLDVSFNSLSADDIVAFGQLPRLKILHLTGNQLHHLPPNLGSSNHDPTVPPAKEEHTPFKALEVLMLDDNKLTSGVFSSLADLKRLKFLNLQGNRISEIPHLQPPGCLTPLQTPFEEQAAQEGHAHTETNPETGGKATSSSQISHEENWEEKHCIRSTFQLPQLQVLNLANNKIAAEEALMAVAFFPMLREIDIHSNPLTTQRSGDPPLLTYYLQERLGIMIKHKKMQEVAKLPLKVSVDPRWKVKERIPKKSKKLFQRDKPCPAEKSEKTVRRTPESEGAGTEHFFVTQATDEFDPQTDGRESAEHTDDASPERLMGEKRNPDVKQPFRIQTAVRMLERTLKNLNVYRDSRPKLDSIQMPYRQTEIKELPPLKAVKHPTQRVDEMMKEMKANTTIRDVPLSSAIHGTAGVNKQEQKEAMLLLRDVKTKHKMVHKRTMEQAASIESDGNTNQKS